MTVTDSNTKFVDKAGIDHTIDELKKYVMEQIANINTGDIDLSDYVTQEQLQSALDALDIDIDLSAYATKEELQQAISNIDLSDYYTKEETYNKEEIENLIPSVTDGKDGQDGEDGFSPTATVTKEGNTATITITDKNGTTTASISDGKDGTGGGGSGSGEVYSTEEIEVGTWIDGRTIYRKVIFITLSNEIANGTPIVTSINHGIENFKDLVNIRCINEESTMKTSVSGAGWYLTNLANLTSYNNIKNNAIRVSVTKTNLQVDAGYSWKGCKLTSVIEYTKE